jgi:hypothetical protein
MGIGEMVEAWHQEDKLVEALCRHLIRQGWSIEHIAGTKVTVLARKDDRMLTVEVRGYPPAVYQRGPKAGRRKPTRPANQARRWYAGVLLAAIRRQAEHPDDTVAIALPDFPVYHSLIDQTRHALDRLELFVFVVEASGRVSVISPADSVPL